MTLRSISGFKKTMAVAVACSAFLIATLANYYEVMFKGALYDDSYITFRYAVNLAEGKGLVFNSYEKVNSASSFLYTVVLSAVYKLGFHDMESTATIIGLISGVALVAYTVLFALSRTTTNIWAAAILGLPFVISGSVDGWAVSGMETTPYLALLMAFFYYYAGGKLRISLVLLAACLLIRPEAIVLLAAVVGAELVNLRSASSRRLAAVFVVGLIAEGGYFTFNAIYYGNPFPHPIYLKHVAFYYYQSPAMGTGRLGLFFMMNFATIFLLGLGFALARVRSSVLDRAFVTHRKQSRSSRVAQEKLPGHPGVSSPEDASKTIDLAMSFFILLSLISYAIGPSSDYGRYMTPVIPVLAVGAIFLVSPLFDWISAQRRNRLSVAFACLCGIVFLAGLGQAWANQARLAAFFRRSVAHQTARREIGEWIEANVPASQRVLCADIGEIAYVAKSHDFVDPFGLTSKLPIQAVRTNNWSLFVDDLRKQRPLWVSDTGTPDGSVRALDIILHPELHFRGITSAGTPPLSLYSKQNHIVLERTTPDGIVYRLIQMDPLVWTN